MDKMTSLYEWVRGWGKNNTDNEISAIHRKLKLRYTEPHRYYHSIRHIEACIEEFMEVKHLIQHPFEAWLALWFHDVIYDPKGKENEKMSAKFAYESLEGFLEVESLTLVSQFIISTTHEHPASSSDGCYIMDIDLAILGKDRSTFDEYERNIRLEYEWVPEDRFRVGRTDILKRFLSRHSIYQTKYFKDKYEETARRNLEYSISALI